MSAAIWQGTGSQVQGHRGARGLVVENTVESFERAWLCGVDGVELDVLLTADGQVVVWHDPRLLRDKVRCDGPDLIGARIDELTLDQLRTVDVGSLALPTFPGQETAPGARIPLLSEVFAAAEAAHWHGWWTVEIKSNPQDPREVSRRAELVERTMGEIDAAGLHDRSLVHSFDWAVLEIAQRRDPTMLRSALATTALTFTPDSPMLGSLNYQDFDGDLVAAVAALGAHVVSPAYAAMPGTSVGDAGFRLVCDQDFSQRAHAAGLAVLPWTVNAQADIAAVLAAGVDALVTDYPDRALAAREAKAHASTP